MGIYQYRSLLANEKKCINFFKNLRWPNNEVICPHCSSKQSWKFNEKGQLRWKCAKCRKNFSLTTKTFLKNTKVPLSKWLCAIALYKIDINATQLQEEINVSYKVAWSMPHALRTISGHDDFVAQLKGIIEVDDSYHGGRRKGKRGRGAAGKKIVLALKCRNGKIKTVVVKNVKSRTIKKILKEHRQPENTIITDNSKQNIGLYQHGVIDELIDHSSKFIRGEIHTQGVGRRIFRYHQANYDS
jgi:transposase-like protein